MTVDLLAAGLDSGIGMFHADIDGRSSLSLDATEAARLHVDQWLLAHLASSAFANRDFNELSDGEVRLSHPKRRLFGLAGLVPLAAVVRPPERPEPSRGRPSLFAKQPELLPVPPPPLTPIERTPFDYSELEVAMAYAEQVTRATEIEMNNYLTPVLPAMHLWAEMGLINNIGIAHPTPCLREY